MDNGEIKNVLPSDEELIRRENNFLGLINKYSVDEGSDAELMDDVNSSTFSNDASGTDSSFSEVSNNETEDSFDVEQMNQQLQPFIKNRIDAWPEKGINFQLKTVDRDITVEEWLKANREFTTTTQKYKQTVINEPHKTTIITTKRTRTTTSRSSVSVFRDKAGVDSDSKAITNEDITTSELPKDEDVIGIKMKQKERKHKNQDTIEIPVPDGLVSSKKFSMPRGEPRKQSTASRKDKVASPKKMIKRLSPQKNTRSLRNLVPKPSTSKKKDSHSQTFANEVANDFDEDVFENENTVQEESPLYQVTATSKTRKAVKTRPQIVVYSPGADTKTFGTKIDNEFISVTKRDLEERIDPKYHQNHNLASMKKCMVPVNQKIVYQPPSTMEEISNDNSESDDDLLTSYTRTGHFVRLYSK